MGSHDEKTVCQKILEKAGLKGYQVLQNVTPYYFTLLIFKYH